MSHLGRNMCQWHTVATVTANEFLIFAHRLMLLYICTKICENISKCFRVIVRTQSAYWNLPREHNYVKTIDRVMQPFSAHFCHHLMTLSICTNFQENIPRVSELLSGHILKFTKGHNSIKNISWVTVLVLSTWPDNALYFSQVLRKYLKGSLSYRLKQ